MKKLFGGFILITVLIVIVGYFGGPAPISEITNKTWEYRETPESKQYYEEYHYTLVFNEDGKGTYTENYYKTYYDGVSEDEWYTREENFDWVIDESDKHLIHATYLNYEGSYVDYNLKFKFKRDENTLTLTDIDRNKVYTYTTY